MGISWMGMGMGMVMGDDGGDGDLFLVFFFFLDDTTIPVALGDGVGDVVFPTTITMPLERWTSIKECLPISNPFSAPNSPNPRKKTSQE